MMVSLHETSMPCHKNTTKMEDIMEDFAKEFHSQLNDMRLKGLFCDVIINFPDEGKKIYVHRAVMASCSHYFRALFTLKMKESGQSVIEIPGINHSDMESIVRYAYLQDTELNGSNIENILCAADRLHVHGLVKQCCDFLRESMYADNVLGIWKLARYFHCKSMSAEAFHFILKNFSAVTAFSEFQTLSETELCEILKADHLNLHEEDEAVEAIVNWINFNPEVRKQHWFNLLSSVRLGFVQKQTYEECLLNNDDIRFSQACTCLVRKGYRLCEINSKNCRPLFQGITNPLLRPRIPHEVIFVLGGWCRDGVCNMMETYDVKAERWYRNGKYAFEHNIAYHALVAIDRSVYVIGGYTATFYLNQTRKFDCVEKTWTEVAPMHNKRCYVCAAALDGWIYACGGFDGYARHNSAEAYNPVENQWMVIASMKHVRSDAGACALDGQLYVGGGFNGNTCLDTAEAYDPATDQWTDIEPLSTPRSGVVFAKYNHHVYALGGFSGHRRLKSVEKYDPRLKQWTAVADMNTARSNFAAAVCNDCLYAIGGYDGAATTDRVEHYDLFEDEWRVSCELVIGRSATSACEVQDIPNASEFTYYGRDPQMSSLKEGCKE